MQITENAMRYPRPRALIAAVEEGDDLVKKEYGLNLFFLPLMCRYELSDDGLSLTTDICHLRLYCEYDFCFRCLYRTTVLTKF